MIIQQAKIMATHVPFFIKHEDMIKTSRKKSICFRHHIDWRINIKLYKIVIIRSMTSGRRLQSSLNTHLQIFLFFFKELVCFICFFLIFERIIYRMSRYDIIRLIGFTSQAVTVLKSNVLDSCYLKMKKTYSSRTVCLIFIIQKQKFN